MSAMDAPALPRRLPKRGWGGLIVPAVLVLLIVFVLPIGQLALNSLHVKAGPSMIDPAWTLDNYIRFLSDPFYYGILLETFILGIVVVSVCLVIGFPVAYFLARTRSRWRGALIFVVVSPLLISVVIRNLGWLPVLGSSGVINWLPLSLGILSQPVQLINNYTEVAISWLPEQAILLPHEDA